MFCLSLTYITIMEENYIIHEPPPSERNRVLSKLPWHHIYIVDMTVALHKPRQTHFLLVTESLNSYFGRVIYCILPINYKIYKTWA